MISTSLGLIFGFLFIISVYFHYPSKMIFIPPVLVICAYLVLRLKFHFGTRPKFTCCSVSRLVRDYYCIWSSVARLMTRSTIEKIVHTMFCGGGQRPPVLQGWFIIFSLCFWSYRTAVWLICLIECVFLIWLGHRFYSERYSATSSTFLIS